MAKKTKEIKKQKVNAEKTFDNLKKIFKTDNALSYIGRKKIDIGQIGNKNKEIETNLSSNFGGIYSNRTQFNENQSIHSINRKLRYRDYEVMDMDSIVASALDIYAEESTLKSEEDLIITVKSENNEIKEELDKLFFDTLNMEFNAFPWVRNLCKYGDFFLVLEITPGEGVTDVYPFSVYELEREEQKITEGEREGQRKIVFRLTGANTCLKNTLSNYEVIHFRLLSDTNYLPYGKSIIESGRRTWKQLKLMEDAMMVYRIMRAPERRIFYVNVGNLPVKDIDVWMEKFTNRIKKEQIIDRSTGELDLKYNVQNTLEDFFFPVRGNEQSTRVDTLPGGQNMDKIEDINYLLNKWFSSVKIPKSYLQYEEDITGKANLALEDIRFARSVERVQKVVESELRKVALIHLLSSGLIHEDDLLDFEISLTHSSNLREQQEMEILQRKLDLAASAQESKIIPIEIIYKTLFSLSDKEIKEYKEMLLKQAKWEWIIDKLKDDGMVEDPEEVKEKEEQEQKEMEKEPDQNDEPEKTSEESEDEKRKKRELKRDKKDETGEKELNKQSTEYDSKRVTGNNPSINASNQFGIFLKQKNQNKKSKFINESNINSLLTTELKIN